MHPSSRVFNLRPTHSPPQDREREDAVVRHLVPKVGAYGLLVGVALEVRRTRFAALVKRVLEEASRNGKTVPEIEKLTGVSKTTFYRWRDSGWSRDPSGSQVRAFFDGLNVPVSLAYNALDWAETDAGEEPELALEPEFKEILRKLRDPSVSNEEKEFLRESIRMLASRGGRPAGSGRGKKVS